MFAPKAPKQQTKVPTNGTNKSVSAGEAHADETTPAASKPPIGKEPLWNFSAVPIYPSIAPRSSMIGNKVADRSADQGLEHEADRIAAQAMLIPEPALSVTPKPVRLRGADGSAKAGVVASPIIREVAQSTGRSLDWGVRAFFEQRFGQDLSQVRLHTDPKAAELANRIGAAAYTVGSQIVFANGRYRPDAQRGLALLAHELAHVMLNAVAPRPFAVARQTVERYETFGVAIEREALERAARFTYWERKLQDAGFVPGPDAAARAHMAFAEENDAVLSVVWQMRPATPNIITPIEHLVTIPPRAAKGSRGMVYQIIFRPRSSPRDKTIAEIYFVAEGPGAAPVTPEAPSTTFVPKTQGGYSHSGFPNNDALRYWDTHQDEQRQVFHWIEGEAGDLSPSYARHGRDLLAGVA